MVVWSKLAQIDYWNNIDYLLENWSEKEAKYFIDRVTKVIDIIEKSPQLFQESEIPNVHRVPIVSQVTLYYKLSGSTIEFLRFWNNLQDGSKLGW